MDQAGKSFTSARAEASVVQQANAYRAQRGQEADLRITDARSGEGWSYASTGEEFSCLAR